MNRRRLGVMLTSGLAVTATIGLIAWAALTRGEPTGAETTPAAVDATPERGTTFTRIATAAKALEVGSSSRPPIAPDFTVTTANGNAFRLSDYRGNVVFINFWATWCPPCREEMPAMERLFERTKTDGIVMVAVSVDADSTSIMPFVRERHLTFTIGRDPQMVLASRYGVRALPATFLVDRRGRLVATAIGPRAWDSTAGVALVKAFTE